MKRLIYFFIVLVLYPAFNSQGQLNVAVYRNVSVFNNFRLHEGENIFHNTTSEIPAVVVEDFIDGPIEIPLDKIDSLVVHHSDIPVLRFDLPEYPDSATLWEKELYVKANLKIEGYGYTEDQEGLSLQIKGRGNSTWLMPKRPIRLKFSKKTSICGFKKAKNFVLLNNYIDPSMMRNALALWMAKKLDVPYSNSIVPCHVFINGHYAGAYTLTEKVGINSGSVDIDETTGALLELDTSYDEKYKFKSAIHSAPVMIKDPNFDELYEDDPDGPTPDERLAMWEKDFNNAEMMINEGQAHTVLDMESLVNYILLNYMFANPELDNPKSFYIHKRSLDEGEKYYIGPAWDFDVSCNFKQIRDAEIWIQSPQVLRAVPRVVRKALNSEEFQKRYQERIRELQNNILPEFWDYFDNYAELISLSGRLNGKRWPESFDMKGWMYIEPSTDRHQHVEALREWLEKRIAFIIASPPKY